MKKYLMICLSLIFLVFVGDYLYYYNGKLYLPRKGEVTCFTGSDRESLYLDQGSGLEKFEIRGVDLNFGKPGYFSTEGAITEEEYLSWFQQIQALGANTIRIYTIADPVFYEAFYQYNKNNSDPLYLIQGVWVDEYLSNSGYSALSEEFSQPFLAECKNAVDVIHGRKKIRESGRVFPVKYKRDISCWVYGYILGTEWEGDLVAFTNESNASVSQYNGDYLYTENAENFEIFLASIGDQTIQYETCKYGTQRVLAFSNWSNTCPLDFDEKIRQETEKYAEIDVENICIKDSFQGGTFASYHCYPYYPEYTMYENESNEDKNTYLEFLTLLNQHHEQPVVISEFGVPSSRGIASYEQNRSLGRDQGGLSETQQGQALVSMWEDIKASGSAGGIVYSWQDEWYKWTWNSMAAVDLNNVCYWSDYQTNGQSFGLLAFDPGKNKSICYVDGDRREWDEKDVVTKQNEFSISMKYDVKFLYFLLERDGLNIDEDTIYIPIDTTWKSGSSYAENLNLTMTEPADFVIQIDGRKNSRLWVQERYNTATALFGNQMKRYFNQYYSEPESDSGTFQKVQMLLQEVDYYAQGRKISFRDYNPNYPDIYYTLSQTYETGKLTYGNANPAADDYNSLADFCAGDGFLEIKIPWQLLNFADPSTMRIHDDYYECHGVEYLSIDAINIGAGDGSTTIEMRSFPLVKLGEKPEYHERLKESYYILQKEWAKNERKVDKTDVYCN